MTFAKTIVAIAVITPLVVDGAAHALSRFGQHKVTLPTAAADQFPRNICRSLVTGIVCRDIQMLSKPERRNDTK